MDLPAQPDEGRMRASDGDRDRIGDVLREALAEGRLSQAEYAERLEALFVARTHAELAVLVRDLPVPARGDARGPAVRAAGGEPATVRPGRIVAVFGGAVRKGRWRVPARATVVTVFGGAHLDMRAAEFTARETVLTVVNVFGGMSMIVPPEVRVEDEGSAVFGGRAAEGGGAPGGPLIRLRGFTIFGGLDVQRRSLPPDV